MAAIGGAPFRPAGDVLRIQVAALLFIGLYQVWTVSLIALGRQRDLIVTNGLGLVGIAVFAAILIPAWGAKGGACASVLGDAVLASLIYWRLRAEAGNVMVSTSFLARVAVAAAAGAATILIPGMPAIPAAALAGGVFLCTGLLTGMVPPELRAALSSLR
jgi:O-antigen/teichoic acid export membrane protein